MLVERLLNRVPQQAPSEVTAGKPLILKAGAAKALKEGLDGLETSTPVTRARSVAPASAPRVPEMGPAYRVSALERLRNEHFDVVIVGGGIVGTRAAADAASRGLRVALLEMNDFASGTSSQSSKLAHGGLRYLKQGDIALVLEGLAERGNMLVNSPHIVKAADFIYPIVKKSENLTAPIGLTAYDALAKAASVKYGGGVKWHRTLKGDALRERAPGLKAQFKRAILFQDGETDDARLTVNVARQAAEQGAAMVTRMKVTGYNEKGGRVVGVKAVNTETGEEINVRGKAVLSAGGPWTGKLQQLAKVAPGADALTVKGSKGVHVVIDPKQLNIDGNVIMYTDKSVLFILKNGIIGTTDTPFAEDVQYPSATEREIKYILETANSVLEPRADGSPAIHPGDVKTTYAGIRPLVEGQPSRMDALKSKLSGKDSAAAQTTKLSRNHEIRSPKPGLIEVAGGKLTNGRRMGKDSIDEVMKSLGRTDRVSHTEDQLLVGADNYHAMVEHADVIAAHSGISKDELLHLLNRYGDNVGPILEDLRQHPELRERVKGTPDYLLAEARFGASHEGALHLEDLLERRMRVSIETQDRGAGAAEQVARAVAPILGWDEPTIGHEVATYQARVERQLAAEKQDTDAAATAMLKG